MVHLVNVDRAAQAINFVLQNPGVPAAGFD